MARSALLFPALASLATAIPAAPLRAQTEAPAPPHVAPAGADDLHAMRQLLEQQGREIDSLTQQVARLSQLLETPRANAAQPAATAAFSAATPAAAQSTSPVPAEPPRAAAAAPAEPEPGARHVVAKGETLTVIAKQYKVSIADLLRANKIEDARKLQIGQTLLIPAGTKPAAEAPHP